MLQFLFILVLFAATTVNAQRIEQVSEKDFLEDIPIVLSVSRLPQRLDETPGAVTILDRRMIRMSGARDVADLLRLVPGFWVNSSFESNAPEASYHGIFPSLSNRMQVLVDGRAVYSPFFFGSTGPGLQTVAIEDIERIEVLRGSNSAAYGARALLGVVSIITKSLTETQGSLGQLTLGGNSIQDLTVRHGWGDERALFRLTADQRADRGLSGSSGQSRVNRLNLRADFQIQSGDTVEFRLGNTAIDSGVGFATEQGNAPRNRALDTSFVQLDWKRTINNDKDFSVSYSLTDQSINDRFTHLNPGLNGLVIDSSGRSTSSSLQAQHTVRTSQTLRWVVGGEIRNEQISSQPLYDTSSIFSTDFLRFFGNFEWRILPKLVLNTGGLIERSTFQGESFAPRLMINWHVLQGHTLRYGVSQSFRPPSTYELFSKVVFRVPSVGSTVGVLARPGVQNEKVTTTEVGYLGDFPALNLGLDVRVFNERLRDLITDAGSIAAGGKYYRNDEDLSFKGFEYQLKWKPWQGGQWLLQQSHVENTWSGNANARFYSSASLMLMQTLANGLDVSLTHSQTDKVKYAGNNAIAPAYSRTDARVSMPLRFGNQKAEVSFVVQNINPAYQDFLPSFYFRRQAYVMLRIEN